MRMAGMLLSPLPAPSVTAFSAPSVTKPSFPYFGSFTPTSETCEKDVVS
jgi:hypothetical protein